MTDNNDKTLDVYWADLFLSLLYAATILSLIAWLGDVRLPDAPEFLVNIAGKAWAFATSAAVSVVATIILNRRLSVLILMWTIFLTLVVGFGAYLLRIPHPIRAEHWQHSEGGRPPVAWDVEYNGDSFACPWQAGISGASCTATGWGNQRAIHRYEAPDRNPCIFFGLVSDTGTEVSGTYTCANGGPYPWKAEIARK